MVKCSYCGEEFGTERMRDRHESPCPVELADLERLKQPFPFEENISDKLARHEAFIKALGLTAGEVELDGASIRPEWLIAFWGLAQARPGRLAAVLFPGRFNDKGSMAAEAVQLLGLYAELKAAAMIERTVPGGSADEAGALEAKCDAIYARLPSWARW